MNGPTTAKMPAFTLVELILALTLTSLVLTAAGRIAAQTLETEQRIDTILCDRDERSYAGNRLQADLDARIDAADNVLVEFDSHHRPSISIFCLAAEQSDGLHVSRVPACVTYRLLKDGNDLDRLRLVREMEPVVEDSRRTATTVAWGLTELTIDLFFADRSNTEGRWSTLTDKNSGKREGLLAIRLCYEQGEDQATIGHTFLLASPKEDRRNVR